MVLTKWYNSAFYPLTTIHRLGRSLAEDGQRRVRVGRRQQNELRGRDDIGDPDYVVALRVARPRSTHQGPAGAVHSVGVGDLRRPTRSVRAAGVLRPLDIAAAIGEERTDVVGHHRSYRRAG